MGSGLSLSISGDEMIPPFPSGIRGGLTESLDLTSLSSCNKALSPLHSVHGRLCGSNYKEISSHLCLGGISRSLLGTYP